MSRTPARLALLSLLLFLAPGVTTARAGDGGAKADDGLNFAQRMLQSIHLGGGIQANQVTIFPLVSNAAPAPLAVKADTRTKHLSFREPEFPRHRYDLEVMNGEAEPTLLLGGTVVEGGERDRLVPRDVVLPPGQTIEVRTLPAASTDDIRKLPTPFVVSNVLAPPYLQEDALFGAPSNLVPIFVTHFLEFRNTGDERKSLVSINQSDLLAQYCVICQRTLASFPEPKEPQQQVVGGVSAVRGRVQSLVIFGDNALLRAWFEPMLKGHAFAAAAIELRAKKAGIPIPGQDDPDATLATVGEQAQRLLERLMLARYRSDDLDEGELGEALLLRTSDGTRGRAVGLDGRLLHLVVFPHDPFEDALFSRALEPPTEITANPEREGLNELERRGDSGRRLTEAEKRLLERLRNRAGGGLNAGGR